MHRYNKHFNATIPWATEVCTKNVTNSMLPSVLIVIWSTLACVLLRKKPPLSTTVLYSATIYPPRCWIFLVWYTILTSMNRYVNEREENLIKKKKEELIWEKRKRKWKVNFQTTEEVRRKQWKPLLLCPKLVSKKHFWKKRRAKKVKVEKAASFQKLKSKVELWGFKSEHKRDRE